MLLINIAFFKLTPALISLMMECHVPVNTGNMQSGEPILSLQHMHSILVAMIEQWLHTPAKFVSMTHSIQFTFFPFVP